MNINVNSIPLHKGQKRIVDGIITSKTRYSLCNTPRQFGKSTMAIQLSLYWALSEPNIRVLYVTPVYQLARNIYNQIVTGLEKSNVIKEKFKNELYIKYVNNSSIEFRSVTNHDSIRGGSYHYVICDEFSFFSDPEAWNSSIRPTMNVIGRQALLVSTPKGNNNQFYQMCEMGKNIEYKDYTYYTGSYTDNPFYNITEVEDAKKTLPDKVFRQEYLGEFVEDGGSVFSNIKNCSTITKYEKNGYKYFAGIDVGRISDYTVLTILNEKGEVVFIYRKNKLSWEIITKDILYHLKHFNTQAIIEVNSIGDPLFEAIYKEYKKITPFYTSNTSKQDIIENLIYAFNTNEIKIPTKDLEPDLHTELNVFSFNYSPTSRKIVYNAPNGFHDDMIISLALAYKCYKDKKQHGNYNISIVK